MPMHRAHMGSADPLSLAVAPHRVPGRRAARARANVLQWSRESPWLALNRRISRNVWTTPADSWIGRQR